MAVRAAKPDATKEPGLRSPWESFRSDAERIARSPRWVTEDQYSAVLGDLLLERADAYVWLDLPRRTVIFRVIRRSAVNALTRRELWNGNREGFRDWLDPEHSIRWAWSQHAHKRHSTLDRLVLMPRGRRELEYLSMNDNQPGS